MTTTATIATSNNSQLSVQLFSLFCHYCGTGSLMSIGTGVHWKGVRHWKDVHWNRRLPSEWASIGNVSIRMGVCHCNGHPSERVFVIGRVFVRRASIGRALQWQQQRTKISSGRVCDGIICSNSIVRILILLFLSDHFHPQQQHRLHCYLVIFAKCSAEGHPAEGHPAAERRP